MRRATTAHALPLNNIAFLSTLSLRRATLATWKPDYICRNFYPRSPCGERPFCLTLEGHKRPISIHALLAESDAGLIFFLIYHYFYPRSPCGERPNSQQEKNNGHEISIHALLAESDQPRKTEVPGAREFLSTLSLRRATWRECQKD